MPGDEVGSYPATPSHRTVGGQVSPRCKHMFIQAHTCIPWHTNNTQTRKEVDDLYTSDRIHFKHSSVTSLFFGLTNTGAFVMLFIISVTVKLHPADRMWPLTLSHNSVNTSQRLKFGRRSLTILSVTLTS